MRLAFAHDAVLDMDPDDDLRAPGAAITLELCGGWGHVPPCPLAPHHTASARTGPEVVLRILFATEQQHESAVRAGIERALSTGTLTGPDGATTRWRVRRSQPGEVSVEEVDHAHRLTTDQV